MINIFMATLAVLSQPVDSETLAKGPALSVAKAPINAQMDDKDSKVRCKRYTETGSLAHVIKECHTLREWHELAENARRNATRYQDDGAITTRHDNN